MAGYAVENKVLHAIDLGFAGTGYGGTGNAGFILTRRNGNNSQFYVTQTSFAPLLPLVSTAGRTVNRAGLLTPLTE